MTRFGFAALIIGVAALPATAQTVQEQLARCQAMTDSLQRLNCYDAVNKATTAVPPVPAQAAPVSVPTPAPATTSLGADRLPQTAKIAPRQTNRIVSVIEKFDLDLRGHFILTLANGQVWKQIEGDTARATPRKSARYVTIERAIFGSYSLTFNDANRLYKVTRVQ